MLRLFFFAAALVVSATSTALPEDLTRLKYNHPGLTVDLGVGLWAWPLPYDYDEDGDLDLVVSCPDYPYNGVYFFENPGGDKKMPTFKPGVRLAAKIKNATLSHVNGKPRLLIPGHEIPLQNGGDFSERKKLFGKTTMPGVGKIRANQWSYVDYNNDGALDIIVGQGDWSDYGWDNAYNNKGQWTNGPLHGYIFLLANKGTNAEPKYADPVKVQAGGKPIDVYGMPSPNFADFDGDGDLDIICGEFVDRFTYFQNTGSRDKPVYATGKPLSVAGKPLTMPLCMIVVTSIDWDADGDIDLIVGQEDGRVAFVENKGQTESSVPLFAEPKFFQQQADEIKFGALVTPVAFDWNGDGKTDIVAGNTAGEIGFIENMSGGESPKWRAPKLLSAGGKTIRIQAGPNGSIQGPAEAKWGYTTINVADWNGDDLPDIVANSIWGKVVWYENVGTRTAPKLAAAKPIVVDWKGDAPKPEWNWWSPENGELATQWRTTPLISDWNDDGLVDLIMLDHEGYLSLFARQKNGKLSPGKRIFRNEKDEPLRLNSGVGGRSGRRKLCLADWDGDGRIDLLVNTTSASWLRNITPKSVTDKTIFAGEKLLSKKRLAGHTTSPTTIDLNTDGRPELLLGAEDGFLYHQQREPKKEPEKISRGEKRPPNVLFIGVDDMRVELGCYGDTIAKSPHINSLAKSGVLFHHAYCQQAVCNPSRASMLTGMRPDTLRVWDLPTHFRETRPDLVTLPQLFKKNGYTAVNVGKIFHNWRQDKYKGDPQSWSKPAVMHYNSHGSDRPQVKGDLPEDTAKTPRTECRNVADEAYFDGRIARQAIAELQALKDQPFFLAVGFWKPHAPFNAPKKYWEMYDRDSINLPANAKPPKNVPKIAMHDSREILRGFKNRRGGRPTQDEVITLRHGYFAAISYVDSQIGKVLAELDRLDLRKNTIIVFWSDHGFHLGEHSLWAKTSNFELDAHVPLIISAPGFQTGKTSDSLVELIDLYPTLADLCNLKPPVGLDGKSLKPILHDPKASVKSAAFTQHTRPAYPPPGEDPPFMGCSIRTQVWRYTQWREFDSGKVVAEELYDHTRNDDETINIAFDEKNAKVKASLARQLNATLRPNN